MEKYFSQKFQTHNTLISTDVYNALLVSHGDEECVEVFELSSGDLAEQFSELVLPFLAVAEDGKLEWRAVEQHKLDTENGLLCCNVVGDLRVSV